VEIKGWLFYFPSQSSLLRGIFFDSSCGKSLSEIFVNGGF